MLGMDVCPVVNHVIAIGKSIINENNSLSLAKLITRVYVEKKTEEIIAKSKNRLVEFEEKWAAFSTR